MRKGSLFFVSLWLLGGATFAVEVEIANLVTNGRFATNLANWESGDGSATWSAESAIADGTGSALLTCNAATGGTACSPLHQCIPVSPGLHLMELALRVPAGQARTGHGYAIAYVYGNTICSSAPVAGGFFTASIESPVWNDRWAVINVPAGGASLDLRLTLVKNEAGGEFSVLQDSVRLFSGLLFADGFEGGSSGLWSFTQP
jgi:hypothetical protein